MENTQNLLLTGDAELTYNGINAVLLEELGLLCRHQLYFEPRIQYSNAYVSKLNNDFADEILLEFKNGKVS